MKLAYIRTVIRKLIRIKTRWDAKLVLAFVFSIAFWVVLIFASLGALSTSRNSKSQGEAEAKKNGEVSGIKVKEPEGATSEPDLASPASSAPTVSGEEPPATNPPEEAKVQENRDRAQLVKLEDFDTLAPYTGSGININRGTISFDVAADWGEGDRTLLLLNFNGQDSKNLFEVLAGGSLIDFITHDNTGEDGKEVRKSSFPGNLTGKINIRLSWDFTASSKVKRIFINDELVQDITVENVPTEVNSQILAGKIENLKIE